MTVEDYIDQNDGELDPRFVRAVASKIKQEYALEKKRIFGKSVRPNRRHDKSVCWTKAAEQCLKLKAEPAAYVRACFEYSKMSAGPFPNMLGGPAAKGWYQKFLNDKIENVSVDKDSSETVVEAIDRQSLEYNIKLTRETMLRLHGTFKPTRENIDWLCSWTSKIPPHVRVLLAYPDERVRERCGEEAYEIFTNNPNLFHSAKRLGYPIENILEWLTAH